MNSTTDFPASDDATCYARPATRGELKEKILDGIPCEVATIAVEMTIVMFHGWLKFTGFTTRPSENEGWTIFEHNKLLSNP